MFVELYLVIIVVLATEESNFVEEEIKDKSGEVKSLVACGISFVSIDCHPNAWRIVENKRDLCIRKSTIRGTCINRGGREKLESTFCIKSRRILCN